MIRQVADRRRGQRRAAELLGIGVRQVKRLVASYRRRGDRGLVSGRRGKPSNNRLAERVVSRIEAALRDRYGDFGATLAAEKLGEHEGIAVALYSDRHGIFRINAKDVASGDGLTER